MRDHLISILQNARAIHLEAASICVQELAEAICTETMAALQGGKCIIPSELFGEIPIPQDVITAMSNGDDDMWFSVGKRIIDVNLFYADGWQFNIYPVKDGQINTDTELEHGKL